MSIEVSLGIMAICMLVIALAIVVSSIVMIVLGLRIAKSVRVLTNKTKPLISQATETVKTVNGVTQEVKTRAEGIMDRAEDTVEDVTRRIRTTTNIVQESISPPMITVASVLTGVSRGLEVLTQIRKRGGNGHALRES